ncbi:3-deoxy-7-phosphoheptulonate synthase [Petrotoga sp. HKA.pet.4.5]|uniref:3-deoxy-7-phosphoheptulonate synthase n=1 Tax=unclassified Petrotoga TaxID=2620614 RepID=UPI000EF17103|nr:MULTISPECIES: 3-deoxy-7-phosphoheptulonate synthase [unclassified Petrotoga]RLL85159.1 3-deoxy-7-phosphoheptulonate synthase [Petrotoga sp. Shatin.DS.tank11.9.2.9.3]RLL89783.1 3-deoxy-7-phosphoheptulonate synthase [Petrotoga sp. HKA.pet.4.5]
MVIVMEENATEEEIKNVIQKVEEVGFKAHPDKGENHTIVGVVGEGDREYILSNIETFPGVERVVEITQPFKLASRTFKSKDSIYDIGGIKIGGENFLTIAGPCAVESKEQVLETALFLKEKGVKFLRGGAYKPRTSPYSFQGLKEEGLKILKEVSEETGLKIVTEVMDTREVELVSRYADVLQIGTRNMQNFALLKEVGKLNKPVLLKRGLSATYKEFLMSAEYIISEGNNQVILCERGIRTFTDETRNTLDISAIPVIKRYSHLPIIIDPSHASGDWRYVAPLSKAAVAAGADGLIIEVHPDPKNALSDGKQSLNFEQFSELMDQIKALLEIDSKILA